MREINENTKIFKGEGKLCINPNPACVLINLKHNMRYPAGEFNYRLSVANKICELNGFIQCDEFQDIFIDVSYYIKDWNNTGRYAYIKINENKFYEVSIASRNWLPAKLFAGKREGDSVTIKIPGTYRKCNSAGKAIDAENDCIFELTLTLGSKGYLIYNSTWETCMAYVINDKA